MDEITRRFTYYPGTDVQIELCKVIREFYIELARTLWNSLPDTEERDRAITALEESLAWALASVVRPLPEFQTL